MPCFLEPKDLNTAHEMKGTYTDEKDTNAVILLIKQSWNLCYEMFTIKRTAGGAPW